MSTPVERHNAIVGPVVNAIVRPVLASGGHPAEIMVVLESVIVGCLLTIVRLGGDESAVDALLSGVRQRLAETRFDAAKPEGSA